MIRRTTSAISNAIDWLIGWYAVIGYGFLVILLIGFVAQVAYHLLFGPSGGYSPDY